MTESISQRLIDAAYKWVRQEAESDALGDEAAEAFKQLALGVEDVIKKQFDTYSKAITTFGDSTMHSAHSFQVLENHYKQREKLWRELEAAYYILQFGNLDASPNYTQHLIDWRERIEKLRSLLGLED